MKKLQVWSMLVVLLVAVAMMACDNQNSMDGNAQLNVYMTDAPGDYDEVWIDVQGVEVIKNGEDEQDEGAWISIPNEGENSVNLLSLVAGNDLHIGSREIPAGIISQIRLILGENNYIMKDEEEIPLTTPSAQQSGLKLQLNQELLPGIHYDLVLDFDAGRSIVKAGNSGQYILKPVIRAIGEATATLEGTVMPVEADPWVMAIMGEDTVSTFTDDSGFFMIRGLASGEYRVSIVPEEGFETYVEEGVVLEEGERTNIGVIELAEDVEDEGDE